MKFLKPSSLSRQVALLTLLGLALVACIVIWTIGLPGRDLRPQTQANTQKKGVVCTDSDPCTIDRYHVPREKCIHVPDPLCTKPCKTDGDCAYPAKVAPCLQSRCVAGQCRYLEISAAECTRCSDTSPCKGTFCDPRTCNQGFCRHAPKSCDDKRQATWDVCDDEKGACRHYLVDGGATCREAADCKTDHPCQKFTCMEGKCRVTPESERCGDPLHRPRSCRKNTDCIQVRDRACIAGPCEQGFCRWRRVPNSPKCTACSADADCKGTFCRSAACTGTVCTLERVPFCNDQDPDTLNVCSDALQVCLLRRRSQPIRCTQPPSNDGKLETVDVCDTQSGQSLHMPAAPGECATINRCYDTYRGPNGFCLGRAVTCQYEGACGGRCDPEKGCVVDSRADCSCKTNADCDSGPPCTRGLCIRGKEGGSCKRFFLDNCVPCTVDAECVIDNWCVVGVCASNEYCDFRAGFTCDDGDPNTFDFCRSQRDKPCTHETIYNNK